MENYIKYTACINDALVALFDKESENYVGEMKNENLNDFFYALMVLVPNRFFNKITGGDSDIMDTLAIAQKLVVMRNNEDHENEIKKFSEIIEDAKLFSKKFIDKVDSGKARSVETYADLKTLFEKIEKLKK